MSWTDERIDLLQKMWLQGMSASKIASELANGLTRNAVIGKVYRLGLSGRGKGDASEAGAAPAARPAPWEEPAPPAPPTFVGAKEAVEEPKPRLDAVAPMRAPPPPSGPPAGFGTGAAMVSGNAALSAERIHVSQLEPARKRDVVVPMIEPVTIVELRDNMCRWPIGDPTQSEFRFCGARKTPGAGPYCGCHSALAYQSQHDRRRSARRG